MSLQLQLLYDIKQYHQSDYLTFFIRYRSKFPRLFGFNSTSFFSTIKCLLSKDEDREINTDSKLDSKRSCKKCFPIMSEKLQSDRKLQITTILWNLNYGIFILKSVYIVYTIAIYDFSCLFLHWENVIGYILSPFSRNTTTRSTRNKQTNKKLCLPRNTHKKLNSGCLWGRE